MEKYSGEEYWDKLSGMSRVQVMQECVKMKKKLCKLSDICDVNDVISTLNENQDLVKRLERKEQEVRDLKQAMWDEFEKIGPKRPNMGSKPKEIIKYLVKVLKDQKAFSPT